MVISTCVLKGMLLICEQAHRIGRMAENNRVSDEIALELGRAAL